MVRGLIRVRPHVHGAELRIGGNEVLREKTTGTQRGSGDRLPRGYVDPNVGGIERVGDSTEVSIGKGCAERAIAA